MILTMTLNPQTQSELHGIAVALLCDELTELRTFRTLGGSELSGQIGTGAKVS